MLLSEIRKNVGLSDICLMSFCLFLAMFFSLLPSGLGYVDLSIHPFEDAAILMRYSENLSEGHGVVWNIGEDPVDGATDFLFMVVVAGLIKTGFSAEEAVRTVAFAAHGLTILIVYMAIRVLQKGARLTALASGAFFAIGPGLFYGAAYFGTAVFALFAALTWVAAISFTRSSTRRDAIAFAIFGLLMGLVRPEGVILTAIILVAVVYRTGLRQSKSIILWSVVIIGIFGGVYFAWRWAYFDYPLPNPFYKKGGGILYSSSLIHSIKNTVVLNAPFLLLFGIGLQGDRTRKDAIFYLIPVASFAAIWVFMSNEMNYLMRFQYAIMPIVLVSWPHLLPMDLVRRVEWGRLRDIVRPSQLVTVGALAVVILTPSIYEFAMYSPGYQEDGRYDVAMMLGEYQDMGYVMATTEAGLLPFYSKWTAIDTWGLNDQWIAHNGVITEEYLDTYEPELVMFHAYFSPIVPPALDPAAGSWGEMVLVLHEYVQSRGYILAACYGISPFNTHYYYLRPDFPDSNEISARISGLAYSWYENGETCIDWSRM